MEKSNDLYIQTLSKLYYAICEDAVFCRQLLFIDELSRMYFTSTGFSSLLNGESKLYNIDNFPSYFIIKRTREGDNTNEKHVIYLKKVKKSIHYIFTTADGRVIENAINPEKIDRKIFNNLLQMNHENEELFDINTQAAIFLYLSQNLSKAEGIQTPLQYAREIKDCDLSDVKILTFYRGILNHINTLINQFGDFLSVKFPQELLDKINELIEDLQELSTYELKKKDLQNTTEAVVVKESKDSPRHSLNLNLQNLSSFAVRSGSTSSTTWSSSPRPGSPRTGSGSPRLPASPLSPNKSASQG